MRGLKPASIAIVILIAAVRLWSSRSAGPWWGLNLFRYLSPLEVGLWLTLAAMTLLAAPAGGKAFPPAIARKLAAVPAWLAGVIGLLVFAALPHVATPLLGDGLERIEATTAGFAPIADQPAPLALILNLLIYQAGAGSFDDPFAWSWTAWRLTSYLAGGLAVGLAWKLAALRAEELGARLFIFTGLIGAGWVLFGAGYAETYPLLAPAVLGLCVLIELVERKQASPAALLGGWLILIGLHYFMLLLAPALYLALSRPGTVKIGGRAKLAGALLLAAVGLMLALVVERHYRGLLAIFMPATLMFSSYHLAGFVAQQFLAAPAWPLLALLAGFAGRGLQARALDRFLGLASVTLLVFFFLLKPLIGPALDWDLFAVPALFYLPGLTLRAAAGLRGRELAWSAAALVALALIAVGPWLSVNLRESSSLARFQDLTAWEAEANPRTAAYGEYRLAKYLARYEADPKRTQARAALERALAINPDYAALRLQAAQLYFSLGRVDLARSQMAHHHRLIAEYHLRKGQFAEAAASYEQALGYAPADPKLLDALIDLYTGPLHQPEKAARLIAKP